MTFDVNELLAKIEANVVPEMPEELWDTKLHEHITSRLAVIGTISSDPLKLRMINDALRDAAEKTTAVLAYSKYFTRISGEKFRMFSEGHQGRLEVASFKVQRSASLVRTYTHTLIKMQEMVKARIDMNK